MGRYRDGKAEWGVKRLGRMNGELRGWEGEWGVQGMGGVNGKVKKNETVSSPSLIHCRGGLGTTGDQVDAEEQ